MWISKEEIEEMLLGKKILKVFMGPDNLVFATDKGNVGFSVDGDCCSSTEFYDFVGVHNLFKNGPIKAIEEITVHEDKPTEIEYDLIQYYGYRIVTESAEFGEVSSVFSFRNHSNGYYGGSLATGPSGTDGLVEITEDFHQVKIQD